ncbi:MAG: hypothetical protein ACREB7_08120 [Sphingopyxis sp.]|uniref:hypothetical protein n=1 Tax=Sphingopyxis sp. TaxID=1908224 RepID=UPI003D6D69CC
MPLTDTGVRVPTDTGVNARAKDEEDRAVVVAASQEAIDDYGWGTIFAAASRKYDNRDLESDGEPPRVRVHTSDCANM